MKEVNPSTCQSKGRSLLRVGHSAELSRSHTERRLFPHPKGWGLGVVERVKERRFHPRYAERGIVTYRRSLPRKRLLLKELSAQGRLTNLSCGGLGMVTKERLAPKQFLILTVPLRFPAVALPTLAYVQWTRPVRGTGRYQAGLSFLI